MTEREEALVGGAGPAANDAPPVDAASQAPAGEAPPAEPAPAAPAGDFGSRLRAAREAAGMSTATLANRMRLHIKQIEALERRDLAALPSVIYVRGFIRGCARELKIDPAPLLADLDARAGAVSGPEPAPSGAKFRGLSGLGDTPRPIVAIVLAVLVVAGVIGIWVPRRSTIVAPPPASAPLVPPPGGAAAPVEAPTGGAASSAAPDATGGAAGAAPGPASALAPSAETAPASAPGVSPAVSPADVRQAAASAGAATAAVAAGAQAAAADDNALVLRVHAPSWVEVVQADGTSVFSQVCQAGSEHAIRGKAPLSVVIGNAAAVEVRFRGAPVDLASRTSANGVARLTLP